MSSRKLRILKVEVTEETYTYVDSSKASITAVKILFSRKLTQLEVSGIKAVLDGQIK